MSFSFNMAMFVELSAYFSSACSLVAVFANLWLIGLVRTVAPAEMGQYSKLIICNAINLIFFSLLHAFVQPIISIEKNVLYVFSAKNYLKLGKKVMEVLMAGYGATYCMGLVTCSVMFVYRHNLMCRKATNRLDTNFKIYLLIALILVSGAFWGSCIYLLAPPTPYVDSIISTSLTQFYGLNLTNVTYVAAVYEIIDPATKHAEYNWISIFMGGSFLCIIGSSMVVSLWCANEIRKKSKEPNGTQRSGMFEVIQKQLYNALRVQVIVPYIFVFTPILGVLICPIFQLNGNVAYSCVSVLVSIYPVVDPIAFMLLITRFREQICPKRVGVEAEGQSMEMGQR